MDTKLKKSLRQLDFQTPALAGGVNEKELLQAMSLRMDPLYSILLSEHLRNVESEGIPSSQEYISESSVAMEKSQQELDFLRTEIKAKVQELRKKWTQRYTGEFVLKVMREGGWLEEKNGFFQLNWQGNQKAIKDRFYQSFHIMVGDAEKIAVMTNARIGTIQKRIVEQWYQTVQEESFSKLLPSLEQMMRKMEADAYLRIRQSLQLFALQFFAAGMKESRKARFKHERFCIIRIGEKWNPRARYENNFQGYLFQYSELLQNICIEMTQLAMNKWQLYLRGFSTGQIDMFAPSQGSQN